ncbi:Cytochrome P450 1A2 [Pteropus alecto]|uniref:unspecific monooxygenase n=1 Tax=Pteropus alecto TaxID=9402 RepID=L5JVM2_PTEAL|nr:Cytochrome P450 1A2 [Pteropus alecto]
MEECGDFFLILQYLPNPTLQRFKAFNQKTIQEHYGNFDKNSVQDITGAFFQHCEKDSRTRGGLIPQEKIVNLINDIFWADTVTGKPRWPRLSNRPQMPYMEAFLLETFRHSSFVPFTIPHNTTRDTTLNGFHIPKEHCVFINQWHVNHDHMGKCRCIGKVLAKWEVFLFLAILWQWLEFSVPSGVKVDLTPIYGLTMKHAHCEHIQAWLCFSIK